MEITWRVRLYLTEMQLCLCLKKKKFPTWVSCILSVPKNQVSLLVLSLITIITSE